MYHTIFFSIIDGVGDKLLTLHVSYPVPNQLYLLGLVHRVRILDTALDKTAGRIVSLRRTDNGQYAHAKLYENDKYVLLRVEW